MKSHPSAAEVYEAVRKRLPKISMGTVYRNLQLLSESGQVQALRVCSPQRRFDDNPEKHYHVHCTQCGRLEDVAVESLEVLENSIARKTHYIIEGHLLEFFGVCPECRGVKQPCGKRPPKSRKTRGTQRN